MIAYTHSRTVAPRWPPLSVLEVAVSYKNNARKLVGPTRKQVENYAINQRFDIPSNELSKIAEQVTEFLQTIGFESLISLEDSPIPPVNCHRDTGRPPTEDEDPYNSIIRFCHVEKTDSGCLAGMRIGIKDNIAVAGVPMTEGSKKFPPIVPTEDAVVVERLLEAGATITAKTNINCLGDDAFGMTRNPVNPRYHSGGSSSGSAAAVAAGIVDAALGADQGGSIRNPASICGIIGLKPTHGLVPTYGLVYMDHSLDSIGPMTKTVADNAAILQVIAGDDWRNPQSTLAAPVVGRYSAAAKSGITGLRIGVITESIQPEACSAQILRTFEKAQQTLAKLGANIEFVSVPLWSHTPEIWTTTTIAGTINLRNSFGQGYSHNGRISIHLQEILASRYAATPKDLSASAQLCRLAYEHINNVYLGIPFALAHNLRHTLRRQLDSIFQNVDLLLTPTRPIPPLELAPNTNANNSKRRPEEKEEQQKIKDLNVGVNLSGHPALTVPAGRDDSDLPTGIHIIGRRFEEYTVYRAGYAFEHAVRGDSNNPLENELASSITTHGHD